MNIAVFGISHNTAPVTVRETFSFTRKRLDETLSSLRNFSNISGAVILSTCNRLEIYLHIADGSSLELVKENVLEICRTKPGDVERYFYYLKDKDAIRHIFRVASGLDSQVLGETQILGQVRSGWEISKEMDMSSDRLDEIFLTALKVGRLVRAETKISQGNISIGSVAIKLLEEKVEYLKDLSCLIIGAGKIGVLMSNYLKEKNIKGIFVASRTYPRAVELASRCNGRAIDFTMLEDELMDIDIIISSTSSPHIILKYEMLADMMKKRKEPLLILDLAVPRDIDPLVKNIEGISLYDLDDLKCVVEENYKNREKEALLAGIVIEERLARFIGKKEKMLIEQEREEVKINA